MRKTFLFTLIAASALSLVSAQKKFDFTVATDGSGDFTTVQAAINAVPDMRANRTFIQIKPGIYKEKLTLPANKTNISFIGDDALKTILTFDDYAQKKNRFGENIGTSGSSSFFVYGDGLSAENITFEIQPAPWGKLWLCASTATKFASATAVFWVFRIRFTPMAIVAVNITKTATSKAQ